MHAVKDRWYKVNKALNGTISHGRFDKKSVEGKNISGLFRDKMLLREVIQQGVPYHMFQAVREVTPLNEREWSGLLEISEKTLQRYRDTNKVFSPTQSQRIMEATEVTLLGIEVFGSLEKFSNWLETENFALGSKKPKELLKDSYGKELVLAELTRIDHGIFV